jgi:hypothetical protein
MAAVIPGIASAEGVKMEEKVSYGGWPNCIKLSNGQIELVATTDVGPRIIRFGFVGGQNLFKEYKEMLGKTGGKEWMIYGGHRLWHAPEAMPRTYWPDNDPVKTAWDGKTLKLIPPAEKGNGIQKEIEVTMDPKANLVKVLHRIINVGPWDIELAPWALTVMTVGGRAIYPQEEFRPHPDYLLPARPLTLWHYTTMGDPRWTWGNKYIQLKQDPTATTKQKIGFLNRQGWVAYYLKGELFIKRYEAVPNATYPDFGCNTETFTNEEMLEVETLGPLAKVAANGGKAEHTEVWSLDKVDVGEDEASIDAKVLPLVKKAK